jgi:endo-1,4-beta-D-glucanase Y
VKKIFLILLWGFGTFLVIAWILSKLQDGEVHQSTRILSETWRGYKTYFIQPEGKVLQFPNEDATSEGQGNAMLRAVVMGDRQEFDNLLRWTEDNLSRQDRFGDHLLSWQYSNGSIHDTMPATDADIDYAMALILASQQWKDDFYAHIAQRSLKDILDKLTVVFKFHRYLLPWIIDSPASLDKIPQNLSYYSPAYFKTFYSIDHDPRWLELVNTAYILTLQVQKNFNGMTGVGLVPDWITVDSHGLISPYLGKSGNFSWEAVRVPIRIGIDAFFNTDPRAIEILSNFADFFEGELKNRGKLMSEYSYDGKPLKDTQESPIMYAIAYISFELTNRHDFSSQVLTKLRSSIHHGFKGAYYQSPRQYYMNSLVWVTELLNQEQTHDQR